MPFVDFPLRLAGGTTRTTELEQTPDMTLEHSQPSSAPIERDARIVSNDHKVDPNEIAAGVIIGRAAEYFDFFVFGIACALVFPKVFFPFAEPLTATLYSYAIFSLAFIARPIGSLIFMRVDRLHGRGVKLTISLFMLGLSTAAVSLLPNYSTVGAWSIYMLAGLRIVQGLGLGGASDGLASLLALNAPMDRRGFYAAIPQLGAPAGFMLASVLFSFFLLNLTPEDFLDWGWRYPFFCAFTINVVALFARLRLVATDEFANLMSQGKLEAARIKPLLRDHKFDLLIGALIPLGSFALFHLVTVFPISWMNLFSDRSPGEFLMVQFTAAFICGGAMLGSGFAADIIGRRLQLILTNAAIAGFAVASTIAPLLFDENTISQTIYVNTGFFLLGLSYALTAGAVTSSLDAQFRYSGAALTTDLAWLFGAGFAPLVALSLSARYGLACVGLYLLSGAVVSLLALHFGRGEIRQV